MKCMNKTLLNSYEKGLRITGGRRWFCKAAAKICRNAHQLVHQTVVINVKLHFDWYYAKTREHGAEVWIYTEQIWRTAKYKPDTQVWNLTA